MFDASAFLANILHRYANIEAHYRDQDIADVNELEDRLCSSYESILTFIVAVENQRRLNSWGRVPALFLDMVSNHSRRPRLV